MEATEDIDEDGNKTSTENKEEDELERLAMEELLKEAKRGAERARDMGAVGWMKSPIPKTNKRFLTNTLVSTLRNLHSPTRKRPRIHEHDGHDRRASRTFNNDHRKFARLEETDGARNKSLSKYHKEKSRHSSSNHHTSIKRHKSKSHKSSRKDSNTKDSSGTKQSRKSSKHSHKKAHRKSKKKKDAKGQKER